MAQLLTTTGTPGAGVVPRAAAQPAAAQYPAAPAPLNPQNQAPGHCGMPMEWTAPALDAMAAYSFDAVNHAADLPPVWRCFCGFQLDGIVHTSNALAALS